MILYCFLSGACLVALVLLANVVLRCIFSLDVSIFGWALARFGLFKSCFRTRFFGCLDFNWRQASSDSYTPLKYCWFCYLRFLKNKLSVYWMSGECIPLSIIFIIFSKTMTKWYIQMWPRKRRANNKGWGLESDRWAALYPASHKVFTKYLPQCHRSWRQRPASLSLSFGWILRIGVILCMSDVIQI